MYLLYNNAQLAKQPLNNPAERRQWSRRTRFSSVYILCLCWDISIQVCVGYMLSILNTYIHFVQYLYTVVYTQAYIHTKSKTLIIHVRIIRTLRLSMRNGQLPSGGAGRERGK